MKLLACTLAALAVTGFASQREPHRASRTTIVMLGTGTPIPDPDRSGPAVAIIVDSTPYLFDAGTGIVRRAVAATRLGVPGLAMPELTRVFLTHLHSDHTMGLNDVIFTPWIQGRNAPLTVYGPPGTRRLVNGILDGNDEDIRERLASAGGPSASGWKVDVHEIGEGEVFRDSLVRITAFAVPHSGWKYAFGYRIDTPDRSIVLSGDARRNDVVARMCNGCDVLIHEVYSDSGLRTVPLARRPYHIQAHTSATDVGDIATASRTGHLILYHQLMWSVDEAQLLREVRARFHGALSSAHDLDRY